jgi:hypothetical protein
MKFIGTSCKLCERHVFSPDNLRALKTTLAGPRVVDLQGKQPPLTLLCVCTTCIAALQGVLD